MNFTVKILEYTKIDIEDNLCWECKLKDVCFIANKAKEIQERMEQFSVRVTECCAHEIIGDVEI